MNLVLALVSELFWVSFQKLGSFLNLGGQSTWRQVEQSAKYIFVQNKSSQPSVHRGGESAIASLVAGQGSVILQGCEIPPTPNSLKSAEPPRVSTASLHHGPPRAGCRRRGWHDSTPWLHQLGASFLGLPAEKWEAPSSWGRWGLCALQVLWPVL